MIVVTLLWAVGCGSAVGLGPLPEAPTGQTRCRSAITQSSPLVTEWPASEKANLEAQLAAGGVAVAFGGCTMRVITECKLPGSYVWQRTTPSRDEVDISGEDDLYAKLPLGAVSLSAELKRTGRLAVQTVVSGQMRLQGATVGDVPMAGPCAEATHVLGALSVGAFVLTSGGTAEANAQASASVFNAGGAANRSIQIIKSAGNQEACALATPEAANPDCQSPIQVFLYPIPGRVEQAGPAGTAKVDFVSTSEDKRWDVYVDDEVACTTPCSRWVNPTRPIILKARESPFMRSPDQVEVSRLPREALMTPVQVRARGGSGARWWGGVICLAEGGSLLLAGALTVGNDEEFFADTGKGFLIAGAVVTAVGVWLYVTSKPGVSVRAVPETTVRVGPTGVAGTF